MGPENDGAARDTRPARRPGFIRRHKVVAVLLTLVVVLVVAVAGWSVYLNSQLRKIPRIDAGIEAHSDGGSGTSGRAVNILLGGTDSRRPDELAQLVGDGWTPGAMRSDTIVVVHLSADRRRADVVSIPRDAWVNVPGYGEQKINAAFSFGGPKLYVDTIEDFTGLEIDHLAVVDWEGLKGLSEAVDGVDVQIPQTVTDSKSGKLWEQGTVHLEGDNALAYVRQRYGLPNGDFDRINRQQNFLRAMLDKLLSSGTFTNPARLTSVTRELAGQLTLDDTFDNREVVELALSMRKLRMKDVTFVTIPMRSYARIGGQSVVLVDRSRTKELFGAVMTDDLATYVDRYGAPELPEPGDVR